MPMSVLYAVCIKTFQSRERNFQGCVTNFTASYFENQQATFECVLKYLIFK